MEFTVHGTAIPQGSMRAFLVDGRANLTSDNPKLKAWRREVAADARVALWELPASQRGLLTGALTVALLFVLPRPKDLPKRVVHHQKKPDLDKLQRAVLDALTGVVWVDDNQVADLVGRKRYVGEGERPHVDVRVGPLEGTPLLDA